MGICGDVFGLWCFPCLCLWSTFMGRCCPGLYEVFWNQASSLSSRWSFLYLLTLQSPSDDCRGLSAPDEFSTSSVYSSSVSHSVSLSKFGDIDCSDLASVHVYSIVGSTGEGGAGFGPTGAGAEVSQIACRSRFHLCKWWGDSPHHNPSGPIHLGIIDQHMAHKS